MMQSTNLTAIDFQYHWKSLQLKATELEQQQMEDRDQKIVLSSYIKRLFVIKIVREYHGNLEIHV